jgi:hypothetical protein
MSYTRFSVVLDHPVAVESLYRFIASVCLLFVIMGGLWKSKTSVRKNSNYVPGFAMERLGVYSLIV